MKKYKIAEILKFKEPRAWKRLVPERVRGDFVVYRKWVMKFGLRNVARVLWIEEKQERNHFTALYWRGSRGWMGTLAESPSGFVVGRTLGTVRDRLRSMVKFFLGKSVYDSLSKTNNSLFVEAISGNGQASCDPIPARTKRKKNQKGDAKNV